MQPRSLLILSVLVLALGAFIAFYEKDLPSTEERIELAKKVLKVEDDDILAITIERAGREVRLDRRPPTNDETEQAESQPRIWRITEPFAGRADAATVGQLVSALVSLESRRTLEDYGRAEVGLDTPRARVTITTARQQKVLAIGQEVPASEDMIVGLAAGSIAYQVASDLWNQLTKEPGEWRDKKLFHAERSDIERVALETDDRKVLLQRRDEDFWIEAPIADKADDEKINSLMTALTTLSANQFLDEPLLTPEGMGLEPPQMTIEVGRKSQEGAFRLELGHRVDDTRDALFGRAEGQLFELETQLTESLATRDEDWRSRAWTSIQVFEIEAARFAGSDEALELSREDAEWLRNGERVDYSAVSDVLYPITEARASQIIERAEARERGYGIESPSLSIEIETGDDAEKLSLFTSVEGLTAASTSGRDAILLFPDEKIAEMQAKLTDLRRAEPLPEEGDEQASEEETAR